MTGENPARPIPVEWSGAVAAFACPGFWSDCTHVVCGEGCRKAIDLLHRCCVIDDPIGRVPHLCYDDGERGKRAALVITTGGMLPSSIRVAKPR